MEQAMFYIMLVFLVAIETSIPYLMKRTVVFGVTIPDRNIHDDKLRAYKKTYSLLVVTISIVAVGLFWFYSINNYLSEAKQAIFFVAIVFGIIFLSLALYFYFHAKTLQLKKSEKWGENLKEVKVTDLAVRSQDAMLPWYVFIIPMIVTIGLIGYTFSHYNNMPDRIPMHWGPNGKPDSFTDKNLLSVNSLMFILLTMQVMFLGINEGTRRSAIKLSATKIAASRVRQLTLRKYSSWFSFMISILITLLFSFLQLTTIHVGLMNDTVMFIAPLLFALIVLVACIVYAVKVGNAGQQAEGQPTGGITDVDEDEYWKGGIFYFNKNDPSIFVEKRFGIGWTINFANPIAYLALFGPILIILLITYFS